MCKTLVDSVQGCHEPNLEYVKGLRILVHGRFKLMYYTYVLWSTKSQRFYIGYTSDLARRLAEHKNDKGHSTSRMDSPRIIFFEGFVSKEDALRREAYFKTSKGKKSLRLIVRSSINTMDDCSVPIV